MGRKKIEIKNGDRYGRLTIIEEVEPYIRPSGCKVRVFKCKCDCGNPTVVDLNSLRSGNTASCGCLQKQRVSEANSKANEYNLTGEIGIGYTSNGEQFLFDKEDYKLIKNYCWCINEGYVAAKERSTGKYIRLHSLIMHPGKNEVVDHINHDTRNNCKNNLRICSQANNAKNTSRKKNNTSGISGVTWHKQRNKWQANINVSGRRIHLGVFTSKADAIRTRVKAELEFYKEYAPTYNYFTREQRKAILNDEMPSEEIVKLLNQKSIDKQYSTCYNKDR